MAKKKKERGDEDDVKPSKRSRGRAADEDDDEDEGDDADEGSGPRNDVYVGLSVLTLLAFVAAAVFLYLDTDAMGKKQPPTHNLTANALTRPAQ